MRSYAALLRLLALAALALAFAACLPKPDEPVEYLQQPDSIIIQMRVVDLAASDLEQRFSLPTFTLYGDGTLIYAPASEPSRLLVSELPGDAVRELLDSIVDAGFLDFSYQQPEPDGRDRQPTTFVYAHTLDLANAVSAYALDTSLPPDAGDEWDQFRALGEIAERLRAVDPAALGGSEPERFVPDAVIRFQRSGSEGEYSETLIEGAEAVALANQLMSEGIVVYQNPTEAGGTGYLPILPYEENFPEFDIQ